MPGTELSQSRNGDRGPRADLIVEVAKRLWAERGFHGASIDAIGEAAGVTGPAIYRHLPSKQAILAAALEEHMSRVEDRLGYELADPALTLEWLVEQHVSDTVDQPVLMLVFLNESVHLPEPDKSRHTQAERRIMTHYIRTLSSVRPELSPGEVRLAVSAAVAVMNAPLHIRQTMSPRQVKAGLKEQALRVMGLA